MFGLKLKAKQTVKETLRVAGMLIAASLMAVGAQAQEVWKAAEGVYKYGPGHGVNSMFVVTDEGVAVFDSSNTQHATGMLAAIRTITDQPIRYVFQSHNHWDHAGGAKVFKDVGATIMAHEEAADWMKGNPHPDLTLPDAVWSGMRKNVVLGNKTIELHYLGMGHGMGMTAFLLPEDKVAYVADLITPNRVMFTIVPDFNIKEWVRSLKVIESLDFDKAIFSHSHADAPFGSKQDSVLTREFIADLQAAVVAEFQKGTPFEAIPNKIELKKYAHWYGYEQWLHMNALRVMLDMWMGPFPWRPAHDHK